MGRRWAQWVGDDLLFRLGVTPVCKCCIITPWENERLPTAASKRNRNVKTLWCCNVRIWNVGSDRLMVLISFGWIREQCHLAYIMTEEWSSLPSTLQCGAAAGRANAASYWQPAREDGGSRRQPCLPQCPAVPGVSGLLAENQKPDWLSSKCTFWDNSEPLSWMCQECLDESITFTEPDTSGSASPRMFPFALLSPLLAPEMGVDLSGEEN